MQLVRREIADEIGGERLEGLNVGGRAVHRGIDERPAIGAEDPDLVPLDRAAERHVELVDFPGARRADNAFLPVLSGVVPVPRERLDGVPGRAREGIAAALRDHVDDEAVSHRGCRIDTGQLHVGVRDRLSAEAGPVDVHVPVVGGHEAVHLGHVLPVLDARRVIVLPSAAVVVRPRQNARRHLQEVGPESAFGQRQGFLELGVDVHRRRRVGHLDHRRLAGHGDGFLQAAQLHREVVDLEIRSCAQENAFTNDDREPGELHLQRIGPRRQVCQAILAGTVRYGNHGRQSLRARGGYRRTGHGRALFIDDLATEGAVSALCRDFRHDHDP